MLSKIQFQKKILILITFSLSIFISNIVISAVNNTPPATMGKITYFPIKF